MGQVHHDGKGPDRVGGTQGGDGGETREVTQCETGTELSKGFKSNVENSRKEREELGRVRVRTCLQGRSGKIIDRNLNQLQSLFVKEEVVECNMFALV